MIVKFKLHQLDCASCANKIETKLSSLDGIEEVTLNFNTTTLSVETNLKIEDIFKQVQKLVNKYEPDVRVELLTKDVNQESLVVDEEECGCGHDHKHEEECGCGHDHKHEEECGCGHDHSHEENQIELAGALKFNIVNLDCASCAAKVESQINQLDFVRLAAINFSTEKLQIQLANQMSIEEVEEKIQALVDKIEPGVKVSSIKKVVSKVSLFDPKQNMPFIIGVGMMVLGLFMPSEMIKLSCLGISYLLIGGKVVLKALRNIRVGEIFDENFLMSIATIGAFITGEYFEAVAVMLLYNIGEIFQSYAVNRSRKSIGSLMDIRADHATILKSGKEVNVTPEEVVIGDIMVVRPGERVAMDGEIIEGTSSLDTSALTGESMPRDTSMGDEILSGVINISGLIKVKITKLASDSTVSRILELVENATNKKAPIEKFITRFARVYTPIVCALAVGVAILPPLMSSAQLPSVWIYRALTFLVISCPCALVISVPLALFAGIGGASKQGVLIKGGSDLERIKDLDILVVDKTGTLTKGKFSVVEIIGDNKEELLKLAAYGEYYSQHPIAKSIVEKYKDAIDTSMITDYQDIAGKGVKASINNQRVLLGNAALMKDYQIEVGSVSQIGTIIHVAKEDKYLGYLVIADEIKETTYAGIQELKQLGIQRIVMLTGDDSKVAKDVADKLGIQEYHANLLPQDKVKIVESLLEKPHKQLGFVGDGINDAPVLARSDIGIAMGGIGSDVAIEAADVVLMNDDLSTLAKAVKQSKRTNIILNQNIYFSLGIKAIVLILATVGIADMWIGVFADVGVTCLAILNSMRALKLKL